MKRLYLGLGLALGVFTAAAAEAATVTFEGAPTNAYFDGPVIEDGFRYAKSAGSLYVQDQGNGGASMEGTAFAGGGALRISAADYSLFTFVGLDYAAFDFYDSGVQTLLVRGFLNGGEVASQGFDLAGQDNKGGGPYDNWTTFLADQFSGLNLDSLLISLNGTNVPHQSYQAIDNIQLGPSAAPEPATWAMMIVGLGAAGAALRRRPRALTGSAPDHRATA